jgi:hypothetical protein
MVHEMSGEPESVILSHMPYARGLQYQNEWYGLIRNRSLFKRSERKGLDTVL